MMFFDRLNDITAVILTTGEPTTQRAIDSIRRQTMPPVREVVVRDIRPFHKALNAGARQVATPFFVQVDADMVLDPNCIATLRKAMKANVGISVGRLRDEIVQQVVGIKMFRTACFDIAEFRDSISPDTDFADEIERRGWQTVYVGKRARPSQNVWKTLGDHGPDYTPAYTYRKYLMEGQRYRHRSSVGGLRFHFGQLEQSRHSSAFLAQIALARGFFRESRCDSLGRDDGNEEFERLQQFLSAPSTSGASVDTTVGPEQMSLPDRFHSYFRSGRTAFEARNPEAFRRDMANLKTNPGDRNGWVSKLALCQGLLSASASDEAIRADFVVLTDFLSSGQGFAGAQSPAEPVDPATKIGLELDDVMSYAARTGLRRFVMTPPTGTRHGLAVDLRTSLNSAAGVVATVDAKGRPRIEVPFRMFGHVVVTEPERATGLFWCYDLLKAGYLFAHIPTALGARRTLVPALIARSVIDRLGWHRGTANPRKQWTPALSRMAKPRNPTFQPDPGVILMVTDSLGRGGSERQMVALTYGLVRKGYQVQVLSLIKLEPGAPSFEQDLSRLGITPTYAADFPPDQLAGISATLCNLDAADYAALPKPLARRILAIASTIERSRTEVVHAWLDGPGMVGGLAACITGAPRIIIQQGSMSIARRRGGATDLLECGYRALARNPAVTILNNSQAGARDNERWIGLRTGRIGVLYNGFVPDSATAADPEAVGHLRQSLGLPAHVQVVGTVMRFVPDKDPVLWIDTAAEIATARADARFLIAGFGPLEDLVRARIDALGLRDKIMLVGPVDDAGRIYCAADVVLLTSAIEGIPNVMIEAQAVGRPVVAPDVGGTREAIAEGRTGTIVRPRTAEALARATIRLLDDVAWRERVRSEGPQFVGRRFGLDRMVDETIAFYGFDPERQRTGSASVR